MIPWIQAMDPRCNTFLEDEFMTLYFGETFKRNRQERGLTQEQIAEVFCVSPQAVSRWECSAAYPDIALLPTIADYFGISIEELLGVNIARRQAKIGEYKAQFQDAVNHGLAEDCIEIARAAVKDFPKDYALQNMLMYALFLSGDDSDLRTRREIFTAGQRASGTVCLCLSACGGRPVYACLRYR